MQTIQVANQLASNQARQLMKIFVDDGAAECGSGTAGHHGGYRGAPARCLGANASKCVQEERILRMVKE
ncbi:MAG: hypothetical protein ABI284_04770 [Nitrosospira sp.]